MNELLARCMEMCMHRSTTMSLTTGLVAEGRVQNGLPPDPLLPEPPQTFEASAV